MQKPMVTDHRNSREQTARVRRPLPPQDSREWLTPAEVALALGCSVATVHRQHRASAICAVWPQGHFLEGVHRLLEAAQRKGQA
jgi:hypothetical protein